MRAGTCTAQQTLTAEAASVVKQAVGLARRRGHAQVTPLHVAETLLSCRTSLLRRACLKSHPLSTSHPLQCRALELCFNVALNRLPTTAGPQLQGQPSLSNALVAALKRAQAHQRRGCLEQQQQPLLAIKVELEQLIISILDDPSVSRVMREAGFSSTCVKSNLEDSAVVFSSTSPYFCENPYSNITDNSFWQTQLLNSSSIQCLEQTPPFLSHKRPSDSKDDFRLVLEVLLRKKRRNTVVVGDCSSTTEALVTELMAKVERGEVPDQLKSVKFIKFQLSSVSMKLMKRDDVESRIADLRRRVEATVGTGGGAIIYAGDLKWTVEVEAHLDELRSVRDSDYCYSPVQHVITELGRLLSDWSCQSKLWLMATANYTTYMKCQMRQPSLEIQWALQAVSVPSGGLALSLHASSYLDSRTTLPQNPSQMLESKSFSYKEGVKLICCSECVSNYEKEARILNSSSTDITNIEKGSSNWPHWLQQNRSDNIHRDGLLELRRKWNRLCHSLNHPRPNQIRETWREVQLDRFSSTQGFGSKNCIISNMPNSQTYSASSYPCWSTTSLYNQNNIWTNPATISFTEASPKPNLASNFMASLKNNQQQLWSVENGVGKSNSQELKASKSLNLDSFKNKEVKTTLALGNYPNVLTEKVDREHSRDLLKELLENIPWQSETIPSVAEALKQEQGCFRGSKNCFLILGSDWVGKRRLARTVAEFFFGSVDQLFCMNMRTTGDPREKLTKALMSNPARVVFMEEIYHAEQQFLQFLHAGITDGKFREPAGREVSLAQSLFIVTMSSNSEYHEEKQSVIRMKLEVNIEGPNDSTNLEKLSTKRKAERELVLEKGSNKKQFIKQSSFGNLDLNLCAEEDDDLEECVHSDLTQESSVDIEPHGFLKSIKRRFILDKPPQFNQMSDHFLIKLKNCFERKLHVDEALLEKLVSESPCFLNSVFEKWIKNVFQKTLEKIKERGEKVTVRVCCAEGGKKECVSDIGYEGSSLPKRIEVLCNDPIW